jgi:hypothetical protein
MSHAAARSHADVIAARAHRRRAAGASIAAPSAAIEIVFLAAVVACTARSFGQLGMARWSVFSVRRAET